MHHDQAKEGDGARLLPPWEPVRVRNPPPRSPVFIDGLLRRGHVLLLAGKGKIGKSWAAIQCGVAVCTGGEWLGHRCEAGNVLYIDPELDPPTLDNRISNVCEAMGADPREAEFHLTKWSLRGVAGISIDAIARDLEQYAIPGQFDLIILDTASAFIVGDENSSIDVRRFFSTVLQVAKFTGAAVLIVHHFGKGAAGDRSAADRPRGSSVFLDSPDAALTLTEVFPPSGEPGDYLEEDARALILEAGGVREFTTPAPVRLIFSFPIHRLDTDGITDGWKPHSSQQNGGRKTADTNKAKAEASGANTRARLMAHFYTNGIGADGLPIKEAAEVAGVDVKTLESHLSGCELFEIVSDSPRKRRVRAKEPPRPIQGYIAD